MREHCTSGTVRGAPGNRRPYRRDTCDTEGYVFPANGYLHACPQERTWTLAPSPHTRALGRSLLLGAARWSVCGKMSCWGSLKRLPYAAPSEGLFEKRVTALADLPQGGMKGVWLYWSRKDQTPIDKGYRVLCRT